MVISAWLPRRHTEPEARFGVFPYDSPLNCHGHQGEGLSGPCNSLSLPDWTNVIEGNEASVQGRLEAGTPALGEPRLLGFKATLSFNGIFLQLYMFIQFVPLCSLCSPHPVSARGLVFPVIWVVCTRSHRTCCDGV